MGEFLFFQSFLGLLGTGPGKTEQSSKSWGEVILSFRGPAQGRQSSNYIMVGKEWEK